MADEIKTTGRYAWRRTSLNGLGETVEHKPAKDDIFAFVDAVQTGVDGALAVAEAAATGLVWTTQSVRVRATGNVNLANGLENGDTLNGETLATGDHVLLPCQTTGATVTYPADPDGTVRTASPENGLYTVVASGAAGRASFADSAAELARITFLIQEGAVGAGERWTLPLDAEDITVASTSLAFARIGVEVDYAAEITDRVEVLESADAYAFAEKVDITSSSVVVAATNLLDGGFVTTITAWMIVCTPQASPWNAINIDYVGTEVGAVEAWIHIRKGAAGVSNTNVGDIVAYAKVEGLDPSAVGHSDLLFLLRDYVTDEYLTNVESLLTDDEYAIWVEARDANGDRVDISKTQGDLSNWDNRLYYVTTGDPKTAFWTSATAQCLGFEHRLVAFTVGTGPSRALAADMADKLGIDAPAYHVPDQLIWRPERLYRLRNKLEILEAGGSTLAQVGLFTDSWGANSAYFVDLWTRRGLAKYGDGGPGWIGFGFSDAGLSFSTIGNARNCYAAAKSGTWTSNYIAVVGNGPGVTSAMSSEAGAKWTITAATVEGVTPTAILSSAKLFWTATADGVVRYRWNAGSWTTLNVQGTVGDNYDAALTGLPGGATWTLEIEVVSGSVDLQGVRPLASSGLVINKLGASGARVSTFLAADAGEWQAAVSDLGLDAALLLYGTNESDGSVPPPTYGANLIALGERLRTATPGIDLVIVVPPENAGLPNYPMADYAAQARIAAEALDAALVNLQHAFGRDIDDYKHGSPRPLLNADGFHPVAATDQPTIVRPMLQLIGARA